MILTAKELAARPIAPEVLEWTLLEELLAHTADVVLLLDVSSGSTLRRWHDPEHSNLTLSSEPADRVISQVHPDDIADLLEMIARTSLEGGSRSSVVRVHPDRQEDLGRVLLVSAHDVHRVVEDGLLIQAWLVDSATLASPDDSVSAMSSLGAAAPIGLQVRSGNGTVPFENERFTALAAPARARIDDHVDDALTTPGESVVDVDTGDSSLRLRVVPTFDADDNLLLAVASLEDVTSLRRAEEARAEAEGMFRAVFDRSPVATAIVGLDGRYEQVNESFTVICGYSADELIGRHFSSITHLDDVAVDQRLVEEVMNGERSSYQHEKRYLHASGHEIWVDLTVAGVPGPDGALRHFVAHVDDITQRKMSIDPDQSVDDLTHWATHDHLTGLANRRHLSGFLAASVGPMRRADDRVAVLFLDLDDFKPVNDAFGHHVGDEVLGTIARRLRNTCRSDMLVARYGGDEFVVVTRGVRTAVDLSVLVERILSAVRTPIDGLAAESIRVGASVGVATHRPGESPEAILRRADAACLRAKRAGKNRAHVSAT
ncbi:MAG: diguanylate cyclase [Acidimicrobiales bacterium]|nr:diguanylate cyclase [Acidimicrobiales bacterium]